MNREQIEKMTIAMCDEDSCRHSCPAYEDDGTCNYYKKEALRLANKGYINGADFVEWLKDNWNIVARDIVIESLTEALQEYLKGE